MITNVLPRFYESQYIVNTPSNKRVI